MAQVAKPPPPLLDTHEPRALVTRPSLPRNLPVMLNAHELACGSLRFVDVPTAPCSVCTTPSSKPPLGRHGAVLRGIKELQDIQKQTHAVLEAVQSTLDEIQQVLRSPEATRGMEKQKNAAVLLARGFACDAVEQAQGAVTLLPANPEAHLLLALSLAADQQPEPALAATRKGLALFDRRVHPLAIEAGLLHALAALGYAVEAVERWSAIIEVLPLPVLFEHLGRISSCFPNEATLGDGGGGTDLLDEIVNRRLARDEQSIVLNSDGRRSVGPQGRVNLRPDEIPVPALLSGLDAARDFHLPNTHRAILGQIARRLQLVREASRDASSTEDAVGCAGVIKFLTECLIPLGNRGLERSTDALARAAVKRLFRLHADVPTLHRAMDKLQMAGAFSAAGELARILDHWRRAGNRVARATFLLRVAVLTFAGGIGYFAYVLWAMAALAGNYPVYRLGEHDIPLVWVGPALIVLGSFLSVLAMFNRIWKVPLPYDRPRLTSHERTYLRRRSVRRALRQSMNSMT